MAAVTAALIAAAVAVFTALFTFWKDRERSREEAHRSRKIEAYNKFGDMVFEILMVVKSGDPKRRQRFEEDQIERMMVVARDIMFFASPNVVQAFGSWMKSSSNNDRADQLPALGRIFLAMREDVGLSNEGLDEYNIHQVYTSENVRELKVPE